jgi:hypothetical protein
MTESWRLKVDRAEEHLRELESEIGRYTSRHLYHAERAPTTDSNRGQWSYILRITEQPHERVAIVAGDVAHNLRAAMDHLFVSMVPPSRRDKVSFPVYRDDLWAKDSSGRLLAEHKEARARFGRLVKGLGRDARAAVEDLQPYRLGEAAATHPLAIASYLDNADKHKSLLTLASGLDEGLTHVAVRNSVKGSFYWPFRGDGAEVGNFDLAENPPESEVNVQISGTPRITVEVGGIEGAVELWPILRHCLDGMRDEVFPLLEPFVRADARTR